MPIFGPVQQTIPGYQPAAMNFMTGQTFTVQQYDFHETSDFDLLEMCELYQDIQDYLGVNFNLPGVFFAGGFATERFLTSKFNLQKTTSGDIDVYLSNENMDRLKKSAQFSSLKVSGFKNTPNFNLTLSNSVKFANKEVQFIGMYGKSITEIIDSFDLSICKVFIDADCAHRIWFDNRIPQDKELLIVDHMNGSVGENRTFERIHKYIDRYPHIKNVKMPVDAVRGHAAWKVEGKKEEDSVVKDENGNEVCPKCNEKLQWVFMQLKCPTCRHVYAG